MSDSKHTPGPWQRSGVRQSITDFKGHAVGPDGDPVVIVPYNDKQHAECLANADLIAAAPDLLAAIIECRKQIDKIIEDGAQTDWLMWRDDLDALIAKAGA